MKKLTFDTSRATEFFSSSELDEMGTIVENASRRLRTGSGPGNDYIGWIDWPHRMDTSEIDRIVEVAERLKSEVEILVVIGIGGSFLGAKAGLHLLQHSFDQLLSKEKRNHPQIIFAGTHLSGTYLNQLLDILDGKEFGINVISKSGTTTEPAIAFRALRKKLEEQSGKAEASRRIVATTDQSKGALRQLSEEEGYDAFVVPDDIGGRFSVLTAVGLLPLAVGGVDIKSLMKGAAGMMQLAEAPFESNDCYQYAAMRNVLLRKGKEIEVLAYYEPGFQYLAEWWKQLYGESEGKEGKGIFPASAGFTTDLHSLGQYIQDGRRHIFETVLLVETSQKDVIIESDPANLDGLNYLADKGVNYVNAMAAEGTIQAHTSGGVPNLLIHVPEISDYYLGALFYFFEMACGISGYVLGVNPFDQPGVEDYKRNMFRLLGKP